MCRQNSETLARFHIPKTDRLIKRTRGEDIRMWIKIRTENIIGVASESGEVGPGLDVPEAKGFVVGGGGKETGIGREGGIGEAM